MAGSADYSLVTCSQTIGFLLKHENASLLNNPSQKKQCTGSQIVLGSQHKRVNDRKQNQKA
jgi:hypothetical protein